MSAPSFRTITLPAGSATNPGIVTEVVTGRYFATVATTGLFFVRAGQGAQIEQNQGRRFGTPNGQEFFKLTFYNYNGTALTVTYYAGATEYVPDPSVLAAIASVNVSVANKPAPTYPKATSQILAGGASLDFNGLDGANVRKTISIFNASSVAGDVLQVRDQASVIGHEVDPRQSFAKESSGFYKVHNATAGAITVRVMEEFLL